MTAMKTKSALLGVSQGLQCVRRRRFAGNGRSTNTNALDDERNPLLISEWYVIIKVS
ncbi:MAG: hypothetical protein K2N90_03595 [Lachnospiraceae bacterium]|nr:hypothetical protein [Lachnospiraceae bacterium]